MRGKYYINITLTFLYFHLTIICLQVLCTNIIINIYRPVYTLSLFYVPVIIYFVAVKMNSI